MALLPAVAFVHVVRHLTAYSYLCPCEDCVHVLIREGRDAPHPLQLLVRSDNHVTVVTAAYASQLVAECGELGALAPGRGVLRYVAVMAGPVLLPPRTCLSVGGNAACRPSGDLVLRGR